MKWTAKQITCGSNQPEVDVPCIVTVFYDDTASRNRAVNLSHRLTREVNGKIPLEISWWTFHCLEEPDLAQQATAAASHADIVIVAANTERELPEGVSESIVSHKHLRTKPDGLIVAFGDPDRKRRPSASLHPIVQQLQRLATNAELDFLPNTRLENLDSHESILDRIDHQAHDESATLREAMGPRDWAGGRC